MLSLETVEPLIDPATILTDPINARLISTLARYAEILKRLGYTVRVYSEASLLKLPVISTQKKLDTIAQFESSISSIDPLMPRPVHEIETILLHLALEKHGFEADREFWKTLEKGQIVEFYGEDMIQLYRSFNFFSITGYSLLDISVFEWYLLWERPTRILEHVAAELQGALDVYIPAKRFQAPKHVIREIHNTTLNKDFVQRAALAEFLYLGSLRSSKSERIAKKGFICSSIGEVIAVGKEAETIQFI